MNSNKQHVKSTFRLGISEHWRWMRQTCLHTPTRSNRSRRCTDISSNRDVPAHRERAHGVLTVQHNHEVRDVSANLETPTKAARRDAGGRRPGAIGEARDDEARACFAGEYEASFENLEDCET
jgi:hypothetical protein